MKTSKHQNPARRNRQQRRRQTTIARRRRRIERRLRPRARERRHWRHASISAHTGLVDAIDRHLELLKVHLPYHESDHVLGIAYNVLSGGTCLQDIEQRRQDDVYLDALGAQRIPDPTTAGDFCRRFDAPAIEALQTAINDTRRRVWRTQPPAFFEEAIIDVDGTLAETTGQCKQGIDISYNGLWGYHPLMVSLANTQEPLYLVNRSGNRPSFEGAADRLDQACTLCQAAGFRRITFRGDTDFTQMHHLDRRGAVHLRLTRAWTRLVRPPRYQVQTEPRERPANVKEAVTVARAFRNLRLEWEDVAEFPYQPGACAKPYRMIVVRKNISVEQGHHRLFDEIRYVFYLTNDEETSAADVVFLANERCNQENLIDQLSRSARRGCRWTRCSATGPIWS